MKDIIKSPFLNEFIESVENMYRLGWDERNAGNVSYLLNEQELEQYLTIKKINRTINIEYDVSYLRGKVILVTASGKYFKNIKKNPKTHCGIIKINEDGKSAEILWGFENNNRPTSELGSHLLSHIERLKQDPEHRVIIHTHATNLIAMSFIHNLDERDFSRTLWKMNTECIIVFPEGIGVLPWMVCGNTSIGRETAIKLKDYRIVLWAMHGVFGSGKTLDDAFGLIETAEKAAETYLKIVNTPLKQTITDEQLKQLSKAFGVNPRENFLE